MVKSGHLAHKCVKMRLEWDLCGYV